MTKLEARKERNRRSGAGKTSAGIWVGGGESRAGREGDGGGKDEVALSLPESLYCFYGWVVSIAYTRASAYLSRSN